MSYTITLHPKNHEFPCTVGETLLEAAERAGFKVPASCRNGVCWICEATLVEGAIQDKSQPVSVLPGSEIRLCRSYAQSDAILNTTTIHPKREIALNTIACQIEAIEPFNEHVHRVRLRTPAGTLAEFSPGQYLSLNLPDMEPAYFSIASQPGSRRLELHIEAPKGREAATQIVDYLRKNPVVKVTLPHGRACVNRLSEGPGQSPDALQSSDVLQGYQILFIAAGTGYAQLKSIIEHLFEHAPHIAAMHLFWGGRSAVDLYDQKEPQAWASQYDQFHFHPSYADLEENAWPGHHDQLVESVLRQAEVIAALGDQKTRVYASGSPGLVYTALDALVERGLSENHFYSDVFEYAPRNA